MANRLAPVITIISQAPRLVEALYETFPVETKFVNVKLPPLGSTYYLDFKLEPQEVEKLKNAEVLIADPPILSSFLGTFQNLKWISSTWAGLDALMHKVDRTKPLPSYLLTRFAGGYGPVMAEYVIGHIIARERMIKENFLDQQKCEWNFAKYSYYRILSTLTLGILGAGDIGNEIAKLCKTAGMTIWGLIKQDLPSDKRSPHIDHFVKGTELPQLLSSCDYICNVLPSTQETVGLLSGDVLSHCKEKQSVLINIGRGDIISEKSIISSLNKNWISAAILDVFEKEPLPQSSPLWTFPQVTITPHVASVSTKLENLIAETFYENYQRFVKGEPLHHVVSWDRGY